MRTSDAIKWAGSQQHLARICNRTRQSVWRWGDIVPEDAAYRLHYLSRNEIPLYPEDYDDPCLDRVATA